jgi:hypothetical protein
VKLSFPPAMTALSTGPRPGSFIPLFVAVLATSFAPLTSGAEDSPLADIAPLGDEASARVNDSARGLAGEAAGGSWESTKEWKDYESWMDGRWRYIQNVRINAMRAWATGELGPLQNNARTVYYPFSGPDFLYVNTLFPDSKVLVMGGLEPIGTMPDLAAVQKEGNLGPYLGSIKNSLFTILAASFFKTKDMKTDFHNQLVDGLLPVIAVFLARENYTISGLRYVSLGHDGTLHPHDADGATGVEISYGDGRTLIYIQTDLGNDGVHDNPGYVALMHRLGPGVTYLKAASYLLYEDYFSSIRDAILQNSLGVVEDDSGIPLRYFKPSLWTVTPYGNYTGPINLFKDDFQPDLQQFYANRPHQPLPFGSGYKFVAANSSLLVAKKVAGAATPP